MPDWNDMTNFLLKKEMIFLKSALVLLCLVSVSEYLVFLERQHEGDEMRREVLGRAGIVRVRLEHEINTTLNLTMGLVIYVSANPGISGDEYAVVAAKVMQKAPLLRNIGLAKDNVISHMYPLEGNEKALGLRYLEVPSQKDAVLRAIHTGNTVIAGPLELVQGGMAFISRIPIFEDLAKQKYWGIASVVMDMDSLYRAGGLLEEGTAVSYALRGKDGLGSAGAVFFGDAALFDREDSVRLPIPLPEGEWVLVAAPAPGQGKVSMHVALIRGGGYALSAFITFLVFALLSSYRRTRHLALHDALTGLPNRRLFNEHLTLCIASASRRKTGFCVLYIDLDNFKQINDSFGHKQGDRVLVAVAGRLRECVRKSDIVARMGGDEFVLILQDTLVRESVSGVVEKIHMALGREIPLKGGAAVGVESSVGIALYPDDGASMDRLLQCADSAMYAEKSAKK